MTPIIDIVGSPGVGKTTLAHTLNSCFLTKKKYRLVTDIHVFRRTRPWIPNILNNSVQYWNFKSRPNSLLFRFLWLFFNMPNSEEYWGAVKSANYEWTNFLEFVLSTVMTDINRSVQHRMKGIQFFLNTCENRMLLERSNLNNIMILSDEPITYRPSLFSLDGSQQKIIEKYYQIVPLPNVLIFIDASTECILERIYKRKNIAIRHIDKSEKELIQDIDELRCLATIAYTEIEKRGVDVIKINTEKPHHLITKEILSFLDSIEKLD